MVDGGRGECCAFCGSSQLLTFHHLIPKSCHSNKWFKKRFSREQMLQGGLVVCRPCHNFIHQRFSEKQLGRYYYTLAALLEDEGVQRFVAWRRRGVKR